MSHGSPQTIRAVVADLAGTLVDFGSLAPVRAFVELFDLHGVSISEAEAREPMGLDKRAHIEALLKNPGIATRWEAKTGQRADTATGDRLYAEFVPLQLNVIASHRTPIPGAADALAALRESGIHIGVTTGYDAAMMKLILESMGTEGIQPQSAVCVTDVAGGRPSPWMIYRSMENLNVFPGASVIKIGDTIPDIEAGRNAGVWTVGVVDTGNMMGLNESQFADSTLEELDRQRSEGHRLMREAGAHLTIGSIAELQDCIRNIQDRLTTGEMP